MTSQFDVFLCHNSKDKDAVIKVAKQLKQRQIEPWLDIWELRPGFSWQKLLEQQISQIKSAAVFVGSSGFGPWQSQEIEAFLREFVERKCPVIPVLLRDAPTEPQLPIFLQGLTWVDFRLEQPNPMVQLIWGITGDKEKSLLDQETQKIYVERPELEQSCLKKILAPGCLIRVRAPARMGKTLFVNHILRNVVTTHNYRIAYLNLKDCELRKDVLESLNSFLKWFCVEINRQLKLPDYWKDDKDIDITQICTSYFEKYFLSPKDSSPLVLHLDNLDVLFEYSQITDIFFPLLRNWNQKVATEFREDWGKLRLILVYSTDTYVPSNIRNSPLWNVDAKTIDIPEFNHKQVDDFAERSDLQWNSTLGNQLMDMVGGHPYLVSEAISYLSGNPEVSLDGCLRDAVTNRSIYSNHLQEYLDTLKKNLDLKRAFKEIVMAREPVKVGNKEAYHLYRMGLVIGDDIDGDKMLPRCNLYRQYFRKHLKNKNRQRIILTILFIVVAIVIIFKFLP